MKDYGAKNVEKADNVEYKNVSFGIDNVKNGDIRSGDVLADYSNKLDKTVNSIDYSNSKFDIHASKQGIDNYAQKKRQADLAMLKTEKYYLQTYGNCINQERIGKLYDVLDDEKITIYKNEDFNDKYLTTDGVTGLRETMNGKISVKDAVNMDRIRKTSSHEATHDVSFQYINLDNVRYDNLSSGQIKETKQSIYRSGIHVVEHRRISVDGKLNSEVSEDRNRSLNEGLTENYAIEAIRARGETSSFESYSVEKGFAAAMRNKVGHDVVDRAYFGGDLQLLVDRFNEMSDIPDAWNQFNDCLDNYSKNRGNHRYDIANGYAERAREILLGLSEPTENQKVKVLKR